MNVHKDILYFTPMMDNDKTVCFLQAFHRIQSQINTLDDDNLHS